MGAALKLPNFKLGKRKYLVFVVPQTRTWFQYDTEKERFTRKPGVKQPFLSGATDVDVFNNGKVAFSIIMAETELKGTRSYEGSNTYGTTTTVQVGEKTQYAIGRVEEPRPERLIVIHWRPPVRGGVDGRTAWVV